MAAETDARPVHEQYILADDADLNSVWNLPSLKETLAKLVIILKNVSEQAMSNEVGTVSIREDLSGEDRRTLSISPSVA